MPTARRTRLTEKHVAASPRAVLEHESIDAFEFVLFHESGTPAVETLVLDEPRTDRDSLTNGTCVNEATSP